MLDNLKTLRKKAGISQKNLADAVGVSQQSINKYENHNIEPDINTLVRIADFFHTSVDYLIGRTTEAAMLSEVSHADSAFWNSYQMLSEKEKQSIQTIVELYQKK